MIEVKNGTLICDDREGNDPSCFTRLTVGRPQGDWAARLSIDNEIEQNGIELRATLVLNEKEVDALIAHLQYLRQTR